MRGGINRKVKDRSHRASSNFHTDENARSLSSQIAAVGIRSRNPAGDADSRTVIEGEERKKKKKKTKKRGGADVSL